MKNMKRKIVFEKREGVELKGLGKQTTYLIYPQNDGSSNEDIKSNKNSENQSSESFSLTNNDIKNDSTQQTENIDSSIKSDQQTPVNCWKEIELNKIRRQISYFIELNKPKVYFSAWNK